MLNFPLNTIIKSESGWTVNVFEFDRINTGGLYISYEDFDAMQVEPFTEQTFRLYRKSKKIVISSDAFVDYEYCALSLQYFFWKCLLCKKLNKISDPNCFCQSYSTCWTPVNGIITGVVFSNDLNFEYHFVDNSLSNLIKL